MKTGFIGISLAQRYFGEGPNLISNSDFSSGLTTGWTPNAQCAISVVSGAMRLTRTGTADCRSFTPFAAIIGGRYRVRGLLVNNPTFSACNVVVGTGAGFSTVASGTALTVPSGSFLFDFTATATTMYLWGQANLGGAVSDTADFDNMTVNQLI